LLASWMMGSCDSMVMEEWASLWRGMAGFE
jgi:hypothetical protein